MDGFEAAELIRQRKRSQHTPIIFLTASESATPRCSGAMTSGGGYLVKADRGEGAAVEGVGVRGHLPPAEQIKRQAELLRRLERREHERLLADAKGPVGGGTAQ